MKNRYEIQKEIELTENLVLLVAKKVKEEPKFCVNCEHCKNVTSDIFVCTKYTALVMPTDECIETGM